MTKKINKAIISLLLVWGIIFLGVFLRTFKADRFPIDNNDDGLFYVWAGNSFLDNPFFPVSHSIFEKDNSPLIWHSQFMDFAPSQRFGMKIARPWFDHPPLGTVIASLPSRFFGYKDLVQVPHLLVRYPALAASLFTLFFTYLLAEKLFSGKIARLSLLFFATIPYFVMAHRQSFLENFLTPLFLACLIYLIKFQESKSKRNFIILLFLSFFTGWIKIPGFGIPFMIAGWLLYKKMFKAGLGLISAGFLSIFSYLCYGLLADYKVFLETLLSQGSRGVYASSFFFALTKPEFYDAFNDGWYVLGFLFSLLLVLKNKSQEKIKFFAWFFVSWLILLFLLSGPNNNSPWYRYPIFPFLSMAIGYHMKKILGKNSLFWVVIFFLLGVTNLDLTDLQISSNLFRLASLGFFVPYLFFFFYPNGVFKRTARLFTRIFILFLVLLNIYTSIKYSSILCTKKNCLLPQKIMLSPLF